MLNPFSLVLNRTGLNRLSQPNGHSYLYMLLKIGEALHNASPAAWDATSANAGDEVLYRLRALSLGNTFAYPEIAQFFVESIR